jgi:hypothetical protein
MAAETYECMKCSEDVDENLEPCTDCGSWCCGVCLPNGAGTKCMDCEGDSDD